MVGLAFGRKVLALGLITGFYALSLAIICVLFAPCVVFGARAAIFCAIPSLLVLRGMWLVRPAPDEALYEPIDPADAPELYVLVEELAAAIPTAPPSEVFVTNEGRVRVADGELFVGATLLATATVAELRAVVARELALALYGNTGVVAWTHEAFASVLERERLFAAPYARLFFRVTRASDRRAEVAADLLAARFALPAATAASTLVDIELDPFLTETPGESGVMRRRKISAAS